MGFQPGRDRRQFVLRIAARAAWFTANISYHHIHHREPHSEASPAEAFGRRPPCRRAEAGDLSSLSRAAEAVDEDLGRMVDFRDARA